MEKNIFWREKRMIKIVAISDTHNRHNRLVMPDGDIIVHCGDATNRGHYSEVKSFMEWFGALPYYKKIFVPGNHDFLFQDSEEVAREICGDNGVICLINEGYEAMGVKFWGMPDTPWFHNWAFNRARSEAEVEYYKVPLMRDVTDLIPNDTNVLLSHGPAYGILDELTNVCGDFNGQFVGCDDTLAAIRRVKPDLHFCGHIHPSYGEKHLDGVSHYNVAICSDMLSPENEPTVVEYEPSK